MAPPIGAHSAAGCLLCGRAGAWQTHNTCPPLNLQCQPGESARSDLFENYSLRATPLSQVSRPLEQCERTSCRVPLVGFQPVQFSLAARSSDQIRPKYEAIVGWSVGLADWPGIPGEQVGKERQNILRTLLHDDHYHYHPALWTTCIRPDPLSSHRVPSADEHRCCARAADRYG